MTLLERRRAMMSRKAEPEWDYVLLPDANGYIYSQRIDLVEGQKIIFSWDKGTWSQEEIGAHIFCRVCSASLTDYPAWKIIYAKDMAQSGKMVQTVKRSGFILVSGYNIGDTKAYAFIGDYIKIRIV